MEAAAEVKQLEAAIGVLGENNIHAKSLHEAFRVARNKTKLEFKPFLSNVVLLSRTTRFGCFVFPFAFPVSCASF